MPDYHLAQANIAISRYDMEAPEMEGFVSRLDEINALADSAEGFVWRLQDEDTEEQAKRVFDNPNLLYNLTVWEDADALDNYVYRTAHADVLRQRAKWFERPVRSPFVLWWIPAGTRPSVEDSRQRFESLWVGGASPEAFTFRQRFAAPAG